MVEVGETAPDFALRGVDNWRIESFTLSDYTDDGGFVVLVFYVYDFSPVCTDQLCETAQLDVFDVEADVTMFGIAPDGPFAHKEFIDQHDISYPLLCDTDESVAEAYDVLYEEKGGLARVPKRSMFLTSCGPSDGSRDTAEVPSVGLGRRLLGDAVPDERLVVDHGFQVGLGNVCAHDDVPLDPGVRPGDDLRVRVQSFGAPQERSECL